MMNYKKFFSIFVLDIVDLIWSPGNVSEEDLSMTLSALSIEIDLGLIYGGIDVGNHHHLVSMVKLLYLKYLSQSFEIFLLL